jgi:hypothetical protein
MGCKAEILEGDVALTRVVILSGRSIFAEGVANRLRQNMDELEIKVVDSREPGALEGLVATRPSTVIFDATDAEITEGDWLTRLLMALPMLQIVSIDPLQDKIQVVTSEQRPMGQVHELVDIISNGPLATMRGEEGQSRRQDDYTQPPTSRA